jgi:uncharacterized protein (DUF1697 family)
MARYALFLRGVNVGGNKKVPMADLRALIEREGFEDAATLLQSGNAVFSGPATTASALESRFERAIAKSIGVECDCMVRTAKEWDAVIAANPFSSEAKRDPGHLLVLVLRAAPAAGALTAVRKAIVGREKIEVAGRIAYAVYPDGQGTSKFTLPLIEKHLGTRGTGRNWNTVLKIAALLKD